MRGKRLCSWPQRVLAAERESVKLFGEKPDPIAVLRAWVRTLPGPTYQPPYLDPMVVQAAATRLVAFLEAQVQP
jgi:hypothetical protein